MDISTLALHHCNPEVASPTKGAFMNPNKALWEKGDFTEIAAFMRQSGEAVVQSIGIKPPLRVLDLGCGDGTTAIPLARLGAEVVGIDIARNLVERFGQAGVPKENVSMVKDTYYFASPDKSPTQFIELFETFYGPTMNAVEAAQKNGKAEELHKQLVELANAQNESKDAGTFIPATFMRVTVSI